MYQTCLGKTQVLQIKADGEAGRRTIQEAEPQMMGTASGWQYLDASNSGGMRSGGMEDNCGTHQTAVWKRSPSEEWEAFWAKDSSPVLSDTAQILQCLSSAILHAATQRMSWRQSSVRNRVTLALTSLQCTGAVRALWLAHAVQLWRQHNTVEGFVNTKCLCSLSLIAL